MDYSLGDKPLAAVAMLSGGAPDLDCSRRIQIISAMASRHVDAAVLHSSGQDVISDS